MAGVPSILSTRHSLVGKPRNQTMERKYAMAAMFCDWVIGICDATTNNIKDARSAPETKIVRVYNGVLPLPRVVDASSPTKSGLTLLFVGRLEPVKNLTFLLHAFREALKIEPQLKLWIVGDGNEKGRLEKLSAELGIQADVTLWGQQLEVARFFSLADVFVMSSVSEGLPMSLLQALSLGLPAIVTDVGGMAEVVRLADAGRIISDGDSGSMAKEIVQLVADPKERDRLSNNAVTAFEMHFTLKRMADSYIELYRNTPRARREVKLR
jgi:glycosyltransferase involved in cell wall biosynthesis